MKAIPDQLRIDIPSPISAPLVLSTGFMFLIIRNKGICFPSRSLGCRASASLSLAIWVAGVALRRRVGNIAQLTDNPVLTIVAWV
jgi:hypothetical protein